MKVCLLQQRLSKSHQTTKQRGNLIIWSLHRILSILSLQNRQLSLVDLLSFQQLRFIKQGLFMDCLKAREKSLRKVAQKSTNNKFLRGTIYLHKDFFKVPQIKY